MSDPAEIVFVPASAAGARAMVQHVSEQVQAFTVTDDHARQEQVWEAIRNSWQKEPYQIRRMLTESTVRASDKRAVFVGIDAYEAAGGIVLRDLFQSDDGGWLQDAALLDRLVAENLKATAETIAAEGTSIMMPTGTSSACAMPLSASWAWASSRPH